MTIDTKQLIGFKELGELYRQIPEELGPKRILKKAVKAGAQLVLDTAKQLCPVDTGNLRDSLIVAVGKISSEPSLSADQSALCDIGPMSGTSASAVKAMLKKGIRNAYYAGFVEFGTRFTRPQPFMGPAMDSKQDDCVREIGNELAYQIDQVWESGK